MSNEKTQGVKIQKLKLQFNEVVLIKNKKQAKKIYSIVRDLGFKFQSGVEYLSFQKEMPVHDFLHGMKFDAMQAENNLNKQIISGEEFLNRHSSNSVEQIENQKHLLKQLELIPKVLEKLASALVEILDNKKTDDALKRAQIIAQEIVESHQRYFDERGSLHFPVYPIPCDEIVGTKVKFKQQDVDTDVYGIGQAIKYEEARRGWISDLIKSHIVPITEPIIEKNVAKFFEKKYYAHARPTEYKSYSTNVGSCFFHPQRNCFMKDGKVVDVAWWFDELKTLDDVAKPVIKFLNENYNPMTSMYIDCSSAVVLSAEKSTVNESFIKD